MTDRPIIFSAPMVRALLDGRKTQTRRLVRGVPERPADDNVKHEPRHAEPYLDSYRSERKTPLNPRGMSRDWAWWTRDDRPGPTFKVPAVPGDRLYVREGWRVSPEACEGWHPDEMRGWIDYQSGGSLEVVAPSFGAVEAAAFLKTEDHDWDFIPSRYRPSIHLPRWASRLTLIVEGVKVERLQAMEGQHPLESDALAEGIHRIHHGDGDYFYHAFRDEPHPQNWSDPADAFRELWNTLHTGAEDRWDANPFVIAITFRVERGNIDQLARAA